MTIDEYKKLRGMFYYGLANARIREDEEAINKYINELIKLTEL
jgi:hypothetical protein